MSNEAFIEKLKSIPSFQEKILVLEEYLMLEGYDNTICDRFREYSIKITKDDESSEYDNSFNKSFSINQILYLTYLMKDNTPYPKIDLDDFYVLEVLFGKENPYKKYDFNNIYYLLDLAGIDLELSKLILEKMHGAIDIDTLLYIKMIQDRFKEFVPIFERLNHIENYHLHRIIGYLLYFEGVTVDGLIAKMERSKSIESFSLELCDDIKDNFEDNYSKYDETHLIALDSISFAMLKLLENSNQADIVDRITTLNNKEEACFILYTAYFHPEKIVGLEKIIEFEYLPIDSSNLPFSSLLLLLFENKSLESFILECASMNLLDAESAPYYILLGIKNPNMLKNEIPIIGKDNYEFIDAVFAQKRL